MELPVEVTGIVGAQQLHDWFGYWPSFHDAEVVSLNLNRTGSSKLAIHTWEITNELDAKGFYVLAKHVIAEFHLDEISDLSLAGFNIQNVIAGLNIARAGAGFELSLHPCYGFAGTILAGRLEIRIIPGKPDDSRCF